MSGVQLPPVVPEAGVEPTAPCFAPWAYKHGVTPVPAYRQPELHRGREKTALPVLRRGHVEGVYKVRVTQTRWSRRQGSNLRLLLMRD